MQNDLPWSRSADSQKLPPVATPKLGVKIFDGPKTSQIDEKMTQNDLL